MIIVGLLYYDDDDYYYHIKLVKVPNNYINTLLF